MSKKKRVAIVSIVVILVIALTTPLIAVAAISYSSQLGTNTALGSPLLNSNFSYDDWNKWEMATFGVFLSNFANPLVDSYATAFTVNNSGSAGAGKAALEFGSGSDSVGNKVLNAMLQYAVSAQNSGGKTVYARYTTRTAGGSATVGDWKPASIVDLMIFNDVEHNIRVKGTEEGPVISGVKAVNIGGYTRKIVTDSYLCELAVVGENEGQYETVFDWNNSWDAQMLGAWIYKISSSEYSNIAEKNLKKLVEDKTELILDNFGNICSRIDGQNVVIIPSAANCHIYKSERYNLLNSVILSDNYIDASGDVLIENLGSVVSDNYGDRTSGVGNTQIVNDPIGARTVYGIENGQVIIYMDSDHSLAEYCKNNYAGVLSGSLTNSAQNWGSELVKLMNSSLNKEDTTTNQVGIKIEVVGASDAEGIFGLRWGDDDVKLLSQDIATSAMLLSGTNTTKANSKILTTISTTKGTASLFGSAVYVPVGIDYSVTSKNKLIRSMINSSFSYLDGTSAAVSGGIGLADSISMRTQLMNKATISDVSNWLWYDDPAGTAYGSSGSNSYVSGLFKNFILGSGAKLVKTPSNAVNTLGGLNQTKWSDLDNKGFSYTDGNNISISESEQLASVERVVKVYTNNSTMQSAMNVLGVRSGTEFAIWTPYIYRTYLEWFGIIGASEHQFNTALFKETSDILNIDPEELLSGAFLTEEEKETEVLNYTYLMLHPTNGREYRSEIMMSWLDDWVYNTYNNIVYGSAVGSASDGSLGNRTAAGFLSMDSYQDNFMTSWIMQGYSKYALILIGGASLLIVIIGLLNRKNITWYLVSMVVMVSVILATPMMGEIAPYVTNNMVQNMFSSKMTYWSMAESIYNAELEKQASMNEDNSSSGLTVYDYVRMLNIVYLDRSILLKTDISKKVNEDTDGILTELQQLQSARWLLPTIIRQFSASDGSADYVFRQLADVYDEVSSLYWIYNPNDRLNVITTNANLSPSEERPETDVATKKNLYGGYTETSMDATKTGFANIEYLKEAPDDSAENAYLGYTWDSVSRFKSDSDISHPAFYLLQGIEIKDADGNWEDVAENPEYYVSNIEEFLELSSRLDKEASSYDPTNVGAKLDYGYIWTTENLMHYFYQVVKDTFDSGTTIANIAHDLQGFFTISSVTGEEERQSFMHYRDSGDIRDLADMRELFTNLIPYMYTVQLVAGGTDGTNGLLGESKMVNYSLYEDTNKSWMFRSNWVTKLMEDKDLTKSVRVTDEYGERHLVTNPMLPSAYPDTRPMIFSEAEMNAKGMSRSDLTLPELKIIDVNREIEQSWTLMLNYVNTPGITTEVIYRQMATDALIAFNREFSPDRLVNGSKALYPTSLDLRNISFDSIMKMLMINATRDASYIYGDTMKQVIANSDIISEVLLLASAFLCSLVIPFMRNIILGAIFYLGIYALICNILADKLMKIKISGAYFISNGIFMVITIVYYAVFALLINTSTADSVLSMENIVVNAGPPVWQFFIILVSSIVYIVASYKLLNFLWKNRRDLGFETYAMWAGILSSRIEGSINGLRNKFTGGKDSYHGSSVGSSRGGSGKSGRDRDAETIHSEEVRVETTKNKKEDEQTMETQSMAVSGYTDSSSMEENGATDENFFDEQIEIGARMSKGEGNDEQ